MSATAEQLECWRQISAKFHGLHGELQRMRLKLEEDIKQTHPTAFDYKLVEDNPERLTHPLMERHQALLDAEAAALEGAETTDAIIDDCV